MSRLDDLSTRLNQNNSDKEHQANTNRQDRKIQKNIEPKKNEESNVEIGIYDRSQNKNRSEIRFQTKGESLPSDLSPEKEFNKAEEQKESSSDKKPDVMDDILAGFSFGGEIGAGNKTGNLKKHPDGDLRTKSAPGDVLEGNGENLLHENEKPKYEQNRDELDELRNAAHINIQRNEEQELQEALEEEENYDPDNYKEIQKLHRREITSAVLNRGLTIVLILACVYVVFLIYGVAVTNYGYSDSGTVVPQILTVNDIKARENYNVIKVQYEKIRVLYEQILQLDAILGVGNADYVSLGADYAALMDGTEDLGIKTDALVVDSKYVPTQELMYGWIKDYAWYYLTAIVQALNANDTTAADTAVVYKNYMYSQFALITNNVISLGEGITGVDLEDIKTWDPDTYKQDFLNGKV